MPAIVALTEPLAPKRRKHVTHVNQNVIPRASSGKGVLIHASSGRCRHLYHHALGRFGPVVANGSLVWNGSPNRDVGRGLADLPKERKLGDRPILWSTAGPLFMHHTEPGEVSHRQIARVRVRPNREKIRSHFHHTERSRNAREIASTILRAGTVDISMVFGGGSVDLQDIHILGIVRQLGSRHQSQKLRREELPKHVHVLSQSLFPRWEHKRLADPAETCSSTYTAKALKAPATDLLRLT